MDVSSSSDIKEQLIYLELIGCFYGDVMDVTEFKKRCSVLERSQADALRSCFIEKFVDTKSTHYKETIECPREFKDGLLYTGYLWDCARKFDLISIGEFKSEVQNIDQIFVMWDLHSCERILIENYWIYEKCDVLTLTGKTLIAGMGFLPEDIYVFDVGFRHVFALTHEYKGDERIILKYSS